MKFVAVTACPTGIAHSQMAAENLEQTAEKLGHDIKVEIQGAMGAENELTAEDIAAADAVIITADTSVQRDRFEGKPLVKKTVKDGINDAEAVFEEAVAAAEEAGATDDAEEVEESEPEPEPEPEPTAEAEKEESGGFLSRLKRMF